MTVTFEPDITRIRTETAFGRSLVLLPLTALVGQPGPGDECRAVAGAGVGARGREVRLPVTARGQHGVRGLEPEDSFR